MTATPLLTARQAAAYCGQTYKGFDAFVRRHGIPCEWWGRQRRFKVSDLDRARRMFTERHRDARRSA